MRTGSIIGLLGAHAPQKFAAEHVRRRAVAFGEPRLVGLWVLSRALEGVLADDRGVGRVARAVIAVGWLLAWQLASMLVSNRILLVGPYDTARALARLVQEPTFWSTVASSTGRILLGFTAGLALALVAGSVASAHRYVRAALAPAVNALKATPIVCFIVLLLLWVGSRRVSAIAVFLVVFPALYFAVLQSLSEVDAGKTEMLRVFGVGRLRGTLAHTWPSMLPYMLATCKNACGMSWKAGIAAELIGTPRGTVGEGIYQAKVLLETPDLFAWTLVVIVLSWVFEKTFLVLLRASGRVSLWLSVRLPRRHGEAPAPAGASLRGASVAYGDKVVFEGLDVDFPLGSSTCLVDPSGTGKTTLMGVLLGRVPLASGVVEAPPRVAACFQEARLIEDLDAVDNVLLVTTGTVTRSKASELLLRVLPGDCLGRPVSQLSGGQRRRVELVRALAGSGSMVLLDEPFASLDAGSRAVCAAFVREEVGGRTLVASSHERGDSELLGARELAIFSKENLSE